MEKLIILTDDAFNAIMEKLNNIDKNMKELIVPEKNKWLDNSDLLRLLKVSRRTVQNYRSDNLIAYTIIGNKIWYKMSDVEDFLNRYHRKRLV